MTERIEPVTTGVDDKGELVWGQAPMPRWKMEMFRVRYYGDFAAYWIRRVFTDATGYEADEDTPSMELVTRPWKKKPWKHNGD